MLQRNPFNGYILGVDWVAVDILLRREEVTVKPDDFANFRVATTGYVQATNEHLASADN